MPWVRDLNPTQNVLDKLMHERLKNADKPCHDCGVLPGKAHVGECDVARCLVCGEQWILCGYEAGEGDIWTGLWPGTISCYEHGLVSHWEGPTPVKGWRKELGFDFNTEAMLRQHPVPPTKVCSFQEFLTRNKCYNSEGRSVKYTK
jgi:hypothetical protein